MERNRSLGCLALRTSNFSAGPCPADLDFLFLPINVPPLQPELGGMDCGGVKGVDDGTAIRTPRFHLRPGTTPFLL